MIQIHNQKGAVWNDKLHEYVILDVGGQWYCNLYFNHYLYAC